MSRLHHAALLALGLLTALALGCGDDAAPGGTAPIPDGGTGALFCEATGQLITIESCDHVDNDCDGQTDEDFDLSRDVKHCGGCNQLCEMGNAEVACLEGECVMAGCPEGTFDLDREPENGCEAVCDAMPSAEICDGRDNDCDGEVDEDFDLDGEVGHCGGCGNVCTFAHAIAACEFGECTLAACDPGFGDLDGLTDNGCEGTCEPTTPGPERCDGEDNDCDGLVDEGFDLETDGENCGACGERCAYANGAGACVDAGCALVGCEAGFVDADHDAANGCEAFCEITQGGVEVCDEIDNDCNGVIDDDIDKQTDVENCGGCGRVDEVHICRLPNAEVACVEGDCEVERCAPGFADADGHPANGCETPCVLSNDGVEICDRQDNDCDGQVDEDFDLATSLEHCGECDEPCAAGNAEAACVEGRCRIAACPAGMVDLDGNRANGCEYACTPTLDPTEICDGADNDCDGQTDEGFDLLNDLGHCGACDQACAPEHAMPVCNGGFCDITGCDDGWFDANFELEDGCEIECTPSDDGFEICDGEDNDCDGETDEDFDLQTDPGHCGACDAPCRFLNGQVNCVEGACVDADCLPGWIDLDGSRENGCEYFCTPTEEPAEICDGLDNNCDGVVDEGFDLLLDEANCGACGRVCALDRATSACQAGGCVLIECEAGFSNLNRDPLDGCESNCVPQNGGVEICNGLDEDCDGQIDETFDLQRDPAHCGACGQICALDRATPYCDGGACAVLSCAVGFVDLNGVPDDGCECAISAGGVEICDGLDNDCNGVVDDPDRVVAPADFLCLAMGVCRGTQPVCQGAIWVCAYGASYQADESWCDGLDNDCDGQTDEPFDTLAQPCDNGGVGACRETGVVVCDGRNAVVCTATTDPASLARPETCNDIDDDCDGDVDEDGQALVLVPAGGGVAAFQVFAFEASRPDATAQQTGQSFNRACSKPDVMPWIHVDFETATRACADAGYAVCTAAQWSRACAGDALRLYPYGDAYEAQTCNGQDFDTDAATAGNQDDVLPSGTLPDCAASFGGANAYDLSGNVWEWTPEDLAGDGSALALRGGSFGNISGGLTCDYVLATPPDAHRDNIGFRCCTP